MKVLITGGHVTPALALIDKISDHEIVFVGRKYALSSEDTLSFEYKEVLARKIRFINLETGKFNRDPTVKNFANLFKIFFGFLKGYRIVRQEKPDIVVTFGSYIAVPIAFWSYALGISVYLHEQTIIPGLANRFISFFAKKIFISFEETLRFFQKKKIFLTGNPLRESIFSTIKKPFEIKKDRPVILILGGSLGSHSINMLIKELLRKLLNKYIVIHQIGDTKEYNDFPALKKLRQELPREIRERYFVAKHFFDDEIGYVYSISDLVLSRSGANTFFELIALKKPAILVPLPWSVENEQQKHAEMFEKAGCGEIFNQKRPSSRLYFLIAKMVKNMTWYKENFKNLEKFYLKDATETIKKEIFSK